MSRPLAVITGASAGIGAAFARQLAARGYNLWLVARREDRTRLLARQLSEYHGIDAQPICADLTSPQDLEALAARISDAESLAMLVNNAGFGTQHYFFETDPAQQVAMHQLHVVATTRLSHAAVANWMRPNRTIAPAAGMGIINVSSVAAFGTSPQNVSYCATKTWMNRFTEGLAIELGAWKSPVRVQALCPGFTLSEFHDVTRTDRSAIPSAFWMTPDSVVRTSLQGFDRSKLIVIPGWRYKLLIGFLRILPGAIMRWGSVYFVRRYRKQKQG